MKCPKQVYIFVERLVLQLCVNCVILQFSEGQFGIAVELLLKLTDPYQ